MSTYLSLITIQYYVKVTLRLPAKLVISSHAVLLSTLAQLRTCAQGEPCHYVAIWKFVLNDTHYNMPAGLLLYAPALS